MENYDYIGVTKIPVIILTHIELPSGPLRTVQQRCWRWKTKTPRYRNADKDYSIRRLLGELVYGPLPHSNLRWVCQEVRCVNPAHMDQSLVRISQAQEPDLLYTNRVRESELVSFGEIVEAIRLSHTLESSPTKLWYPYLVRIEHGVSRESGSSKQSLFMPIPGTPSTSQSSPGLSPTHSGVPDSPSSGSTTSPGRRRQSGTATRPSRRSRTGFRPLSLSANYNRTSTTPQPSPTRDGNGREPTVVIHNLFQRAWDWWRYQNTSMDWMDDAACLSIGPEAFFPADNSPPSPVARKTCRECPVRLQCLGTSLGQKIVAGIWGGFTPTERDKYASAAVGLTGAAGYKYRKPRRNQPDSGT